MIYNSGERKAWPDVHSYPPSLSAFVGKFSLYIGSFIKLIAFFIALSTMLYTYYEGMNRRLALIFVTTIIVYLAAIHVVFAAPHWRYGLTLIPGLILIAGLGIDSHIKSKHRSIDAAMQK